MRKRFTLVYDDDVIAEIEADTRTEGWWIAVEKYHADPASGNWWLRRVF